ncbi:DUF3073 domain-containing protein [Phytoactinopolyspora alkaliphila]|uniref:DUF3073 domain-containing protein n=1 Tax=Phytoactinopolyspora alkaliphila TaxID=1783498 RepID=A0A6N9YM40_9ACTN|nr:DUF3073 domain-containing protein [Phytoactinopolyspora alkaliphila]NED96025.1 DUF3073 domain-containing protein [Phytoactinopolyspora alkaliphila]
MGRGRAKAKQTKVARRLKYQTLDTDFDALQRELRGGENADGQPEDYAAEFDVDEQDDEDEGPHRRVS